MRTERLKKKLHKLYLIEVAGDVVSNSQWITKIKSAEAGESFEITPDSIPNNCSAHEIIKNYDLKYEVLRESPEASWLGPALNADDLLFLFRAKDFPQFSHGWLLCADDVSAIENGSVAEST